MRFMFFSQSNKLRKRKTYLKLVYHPTFFIAVINCRCPIVEVYNGLSANKLAGKSKISEGL